MSVVAGFMNFAGLLPGKDAGLGKKGMPPQSLWVFFIFGVVKSRLFNEFFPSVPCKGRFQYPLLHRGFI
jgi:hypothetical protein